MTDATVQTDDFVSWGEFLGSGYRAALALVCMAVWLHAADSLIVATMLPAIVSEIGGAGLVGWSVSLYEIASLVAGAASALLTMRFGLRLPMALAALCFGFGCLVSAFAPNMPILLSGRLFQGLGGGGLVAMSFVAISVLFPRRYTARAIAAVSAFWGISAFLGPLISDVFVEYATWRWGFGFFALQALALSVWIAMRADQSAPRVETQGAFPLRRLGLLCVAVVLVSLGGVEIDLTRTTALVVLGLASLALFLRLDGRAQGNRLLPRAPLDIRTPVGASMLMLLSLALATVAITAFGPLLMVAIHGTSALVAGYVIACSSIGWTFSAVLFSGSPERLDRLMIAIGVAMIGASVIGFVYAVASGPIWLIAAFAGLEGAGFGLAWTFILRRTTALAPADEVQRISGAIPTVQRLGYALGAAYIGIVANSIGFAEMDSAEAAARVARGVFAACLPFAALGILGMAGLVRTDPVLDGVKPA